MSNYIQIEMKTSKYGDGGALYAKANIKLDNINAPFRNKVVKIDTGCSISTIPLQKWGVADTLCRQYKDSDIKNNLDYIASYGVETGGEEHQESVTYQEKLMDKALKFRHKTSDFSINGVKINNPDIHINYNRKGNVLIGMDILKDWDIHIAKSLITGKTTFLGCPRDQINDEYLLALEREFGIISRAEASLCKEAIKNGDIPLTVDNKPILISSRDKK